MKKIIYIILLSTLPILTFAQLNVLENKFDFGQDAGASAVYLRVGYDRGASGTSAIDFIGNTAYPSYGFRFGYTGAGNSVIFHRGTNPFLIQATEAASIYFRTASTNRLTITSAGKVGIGTTAPDASTLLDVKGAIGYNGTMVNTSDKRLKANEEQFAYGLNEVLALSPIFYSYNGKAGTNSEDTHVGIYAQDLKKVAPRLVSEFTHEELEIDVVEDETGMEVTEKVKKSPETYLNINESSIKYMLINAVKEQQAIIATLEERISKMEVFNNTAELPNTSKTIKLGISGQ